MKKLLGTDRNFPAWLTMSWAWEQSMEDPDEVKAAIARNLRHLREDHGLTQQSLAALSRASLVTLKQIESAKILPDIVLIGRLAQVLDVACTALLCPAGDGKGCSTEQPGQI